MTQTQIKQAFQAHQDALGMSKKRIAEILGYTQGVFANKWNDAMPYHFFKVEDLQKFEDFIKEYAEKL